MTEKLKAGFTLIELLVVIAIIGILASVIFPVFARAREKGRQAACTSNVKQLALAFSMYVQDNDEAFPGAPDGTAGAGQYGGWVWYPTFPSPQTAPNPIDPTKGGLFPYVKNPQVYVCPSDRKQRGCSYEMNGNLRWAGLPSVEDDSGCILLAEEDQFGTANDGYFNVSQDPVMRRHNSGSVFAFVDGHAKWEKWSDQKAWENCSLTPPG